MKKRVMYGTIGVLFLATMLTGCGKSSLKVSGDKSTTGAAVETKQEKAAYEPLTATTELPNVLTAYNGRWCELIDTGKEFDSKEYNLVDVALSDLAEEQSDNIYEHDYIKVKKGVTLEQMGQSNPQCFLGIKKYTDADGKTHDAATFFVNDNYVVLYQADKNNYEIHTCRLNFQWVKGEGEEFAFELPFPVAFTLDGETYDAEVLKDKNILNEAVFDHCTYDSVKTFYETYYPSMMSTDTPEGYTADDADQVLVFSIYRFEGDEMNPKNAEVENRKLIVDFSNGSMILWNTKENKEAGSLAGTQQNRISGFKKLVTADGYEYCADNKGNIYRVKNEKAELVLSRTEEMQKIEDEYTSYTCVGDGFEVEKGWKENGRIYICYRYDMSESDETWSTYVVVSMKKDGKGMRYEKASSDKMNQ